MARQSGSAGTRVDTERLGMTQYAANPSYGVASEP